MSLVKIYRLGCEGPHLAARLQRHVSYNDHVPFSALSESSAKARRTATRKGWTRVTKTFPIFADQPNGPATDIKFDLCPSCSEQLKGN